MDSFFEVTVDQYTPFVGKLRVFPEDRHEISGKRTASAAALCSYDLIDRDLDKSQRNFRIRTSGREDIIKDFKRRDFASHHPCLIIFFAHFICFYIIF